MSDEPPTNNWLIYLECHIVVSDILFWWRNGSGMNECYGWLARKNIKIMKVYWTATSLRPVPWLVGDWTTHQIRSFPQLVVIFFETTNQLNLWPCIEHIRGLHLVILWGTTMLDSLHISTVINRYIYIYMNYTYTYVHSTWIYLDIYLHVTSLKMGKPSTTPPSIQKKTVRIPTVDAEATSNPAGPCSWQGIQGLWSMSLWNTTQTKNYHHFEPP